METASEFYASFCYKKWKEFEKVGNNQMARFYKNRYREEIIRSKSKPHNQYFDNLKQFPMINSN